MRAAQPHRRRNSAIRSGRCWARSMMSGSIARWIEARTSPSRSSPRKRGPSSLALDSRFRGNERSINRLLAVLLQHAGAGLAQLGAVGLEAAQYRIVVAGDFLAQPR